MRDVSLRRSEGVAQAVVNVDVKARQFRAVGVVVSVLQMAEVLPLLPRQRT